MSLEQQLADGMGEHRGGAAADRLCELCVDLLGVDAAAISLTFAGTHTATLGVSDPAARRLGDLQFDLGEGPCLQAVADRTTVLVPDLRDLTRTRWPMYRPAMLDLQVRGVFAVPVLLGGEYVGTVDLFRRVPGPLSADALAGARAAALLAQLPLLDLLAGRLQVGATDPAGQEWQELAALTRIEVSQATGMVVGRLDVDPDEALVLIRAHAFAIGATTLDVAREILAGRLSLEL